MLLSGGTIWRSISDVCCVPLIHLHSISAATGRSPFSAPGRTELGGNHTDHQRGHVLAASINLDVIAVVARRTDRTICVKSEGFPADVISLDELEPVTDQKPTAAELIRGAATGSAVRMSVGYL
ncbi:MAG: galactokinase family protein [Ruminococcus callidus]